MNEEREPEGIVLRVLYDPVLVSAEFLAEHVAELEGVALVSLSEDETVESLREDVAVLERLRAWDIRTIDRLDKAMADVWDAGYTQGSADGESGNHVFDPAPNPYRGEQ